MPKKPQPLAKLSRPRLYDALPRERLFSLLDEKRRHPAIWITGPPGAGKTTLVGSYVHARREPAVWYQIDREDADASTFFYFLTQACSPSKAAKRLPRPGPEGLAFPAAFARKYFRRLFLHLPGLVVLDNFHEIADTAAIVEALDAGIPEIPEGSCLVVISRTDPPAGLARQVACRQIGIVDPQALRLDLEETRAIIGARGDEALAGRLHAGCDGWAAGVVLMKEASVESSRGNGAQDRSVSAVTFDYFATQVLDHLDGDARSVVLQTALLPHFSLAWTAGLTGIANAPEIVERLYRRHLFVNRRDQGTYQYHALFREFLLSRTESGVGRAEVLRIRERGATLFEKSGDFEAAFHLRVASEDWLGMRRLAGERAESLLAAGRWRSLVQWLDALRSQDFDTDAWLVYWRGVATLATNAASARKVLEKAYSSFAEAGVRTGQLQALSQILGSYFLEWDTVETMDPWIAAMEAAIRDSRPAAEDALARAHASLVVALLYRQPAHPLLHAGARLVADRLESEPDPTQKLRMAIFLAHYYDIMGEHSRAKRAIGMMEQLLSREDVDPLTAVVACMRCAHHAVTSGQHGLAVATADRALAMAREHKFPGDLVGFLMVCHAHALLNAGRFQEAEQALRDARALIDFRHRMIVIYLYWCEFWCGALSDDRSRLRLLWDEFARIPPAGVPINTAYNMPVVWFLVQEGRLEEATTRVERWKEGLTGMGSPFIDFNLELMEAFIRLRCGEREAAVAALRKAFGIGASRGFGNTLSWMPQVMAELCVLALKEDIEPGYVRRLIHDRALAAPDPTLDAWPWPVRIYALGRFDIYIGDKLLAFPGRPQHRTLELLKAIIGFGGRAVSVARIAALLWPDAEGDAAHRSFSVALHRLRRLLGHDAAVRMKDGQLSLDRQWCWVDAMVLEDQTEEGIRSDGLERLAALYQGHLLDGEDAPWLIPRRQVLHARFRHVIQGLGTQLEERNEWAQAVAIYRRALERDGLSEEFYRRIMVCCSRQGRIAEALETYRRCRETLSIVLGIAPSAETQALFRSLQSAGAGVIGI